MISLPLMLGMGVDNGINIVYDFRRQTDRYRISPSTAVAVILNTLTTMVGFAVLMLADHRGLQSLGRVLTIGMSCCLVSSLVILPAFLAWITRNRRERNQEISEPAREERFVAEDGQIARQPALAPAFRYEILMKITLTRLRQPIKAGPCRKFGRHQTPMAKKNRSMREKTQKKSCLFSPHRRPTTLGHGCENEVRKPNPEGTIPISAGAIRTPS